MDIKARDKFIQDYLRELCVEILGWKRTGILEGDGLRELASRFFVDQEDHGLMLAEEAVKTAALGFVVATPANLSGDAASEKDLNKLVAAYLPQILGPSAVNPEAGIRYLAQEVERITRADAAAIAFDAANRISSHR